MLDTYITKVIAVIGGTAGLYLILCVYGYIYHSSNVPIGLPVAFYASGVMAGIFVTFVLTREGNS